MNIEKDVSVNRHDLEFEWVRQASTYHFYLVKHAEANQQREEDKDALDQVVARLYDEKRADLGDKVTETAIKRAIEMEPEYRSVVEQAKQYDHKINLLSAAIKAMEHKKTVLENLTKLHLSNWYAEPTGQSKEDREREEAASRKSHAEGLENSLGGGSGKPPRRLGKVGK